MKSFSNFENPEKIYGKYQRFIIDSHRFVKRESRKYVGGVPLMYDAKSRTLVVDAEDNHTIVYGATGSLKSRSVVMPTMRVLGVAGESMIINDSKGELYTNLAYELKEQGYDILVINFREPSFGNAWNPLYIPYMFYIEGDFDKAAEFANDIASNLMKDGYGNDPFWQNSAADLMFGLIMLLFKYAKDHSLPYSAVNMGNIIELRRKIFTERRPQDCMLWKYASGDELISARLSGSIETADDTRKGILSVFDQKLGSFTIRSSLLDMLANNDIDIGLVGFKKVAIFLITPDEKTTYHPLVSVFIKQSYEYLIYLATQNQSNAVDNRVNYILDEFSSLPAINDMPAMISAARSRDIRFLLIVQSKHQLKKRYEEEADTIISNCNNWIFLTSRELELLRELSELCGEKANRLPNISVFDLQHLSKEMNEAVILCSRMKPAFVSLLDIDKFGWKKHGKLPMENHVRRNRERLKFGLKPEIIERLVPKPPMKESSSEVSSIFSQISPQTKIDSNVNGNSEQLLDIDNLIKQIDQKIEELEKEESDSTNSDTGDKKGDKA